MIIDQIKTTNFIGHKNRVLTLPRQGIVLITGENGAGKSTFTEAVAYALWQKTLRGTDPWQENVTGEVSVKTPTLTVTRAQPKGGKPTLVWAHRDITGKENEDTRSKAQAALNDQIQEFAVWRNGSVLSAGDATQFTSASDSDKKSLIELMLNLETTEPAVKVLREDLKAAEKLLQTSETKIAVLTANISGCDKRISDSGSLTKAGTVDSGVSPDLQTMISEGQALSAQIETAQTDAVSADQAVNAARTSLALLRQKLSANTAMSELDGSACVTCGRPLDSSYHAHVAEAIKPTIEAQRAKEAATIAQGKQLAATATAAKSALESLITRRDKLRADVRVAQDRVRAAAEAERIRVDAVSARDKYVAERELLQIQVRDLTEQIRISKLSESVLSTQGLRSYLLGSALDSLTFMANIWMSRIAHPDFRVTIKPYSDSGIKNAISIDVAGAGGGKGYKAASMGERKRIDLAILLALGELSRRAHGVDMGTLWFDECFDGLDIPGRAAVVQMLVELAATRCCVVVSHHTDLIELLKPHSQSVWLEKQT